MRHDPDRMFVGLRVAALIPCFNEKVTACSLVPRLLSAVLATGLVLLAFLSFAGELILNSVARGRKEIKRLAYLAIPALRVR